MGAALLFTIASVSLFWLDRVIDVMMPASWRGANIGRRLRSAASAMGDYRRHPGTLLRVLMLSFAVQLLRIAQAYVLGLGLGIAVPFGYYLAFMPIGLLLLLLPVSISGFGLPQGAIVWLLRPMHVPDRAVVRAVHVDRAVRAGGQSPRRVALFARTSSRAATIAGRGQSAHR